MTGDDRGVEGVCEGGANGGVDELGLRVCLVVSCGGGWLVVVRGVKSGVWGGWFWKFGAWWAEKW